MAPDLDPYPGDLVAHVIDQANRDAERVVAILELVGLGSATVPEWPPALLLRLAAATRLMSWEAAGLSPHIDEGLPNAADALWWATHTPHELEDPNRDLALRVFQIGLDRMAWSGPRDLDAEILLDGPDEGEMVDALAKFLWEHRLFSMAQPAEAIQ